MAVLPWGHSRNQTNSSSEKIKIHTLDWFSRTTTEPSRQAINQLMKQHSRAVSGGSATTRASSRAGTPSSQRSHRTAISVDSRTTSTRNTSLERSKPSQSRPATPARQNTSDLERSDSTSKSLFQKGGLLRRKRSKNSMNVSSSSIGGIVSPQRPASSRAGSRSRDPTSPLSTDEARPPISKPFDFTHIVHGDLSTFTGLGRIDEGDFNCQFDEIQARYRTVTSPGKRISSNFQSASPIHSWNPTEDHTALPQIPTLATPSSPPPAPPPKDSPPPNRSPAAIDNVRSSRSTENFSRPTPRSPTTSIHTISARPSSTHLQNVVLSTSVSDEPESDLVKPLPQLPTVVHAVSTQDDTARLLMSSPLPPPPNSIETGFSRHHRQSSSKSSLRHTSSFPSSRHPQGSITTSDNHLLRIKEEDGVARPKSDHELMQRTDRCYYEDEALTERTHMKAEDWEVAIDSAWDFEDDEQFTQAGGLIARSPSSRDKVRESYLTIEQPTQEDQSLPTTPLMTMAPANTSRSQGNGENWSESSEGKLYIKRNSSCLVGLGIEANGNTITSSRVSRPPALEVVTSGSSRHNVSPRLTRSAYSAISHSSSQESIILSIASSIMSTQRSSVSSVSVSDYAHTGKSERGSIPGISPIQHVAVQKAARPESTCLPPALLQQMNQEMQKAARPDSTCLPSMPLSNRNSVVSFQNRPESICLPKDLLATFPIPEARSYRKPSASTIQSKPDEEDEEDKIVDLPKMDLHSRAVQLNRTDSSTSANASTDTTSASRQRSSTQGSRTRPARTSYSLFPNGAEKTPVTSGVDTGAVAS